MKEITLEELLEAGCHFGHQVSKQNPKTRDFVFEARDNIHIIDLEKTKEGLEKAGEFIKQVAQKPDSTILILGTKRQAAALVKEEVKRAFDDGADNLFAVTARWIGGTMTNFGEITKNYKKLKDLSEKLKNEFEKAKYTKKEVSLWDKERQKLDIYYGGTKDMTKVPDVVFIIDTHSEELAVQEALAMNVPIVGIVDTNADPDMITYSIPANDDAAGSIKLILSYVIDAWIEGKKKQAKEAAETKLRAEEEAEKAKEKTEEKEKEPKKTEVKEEKKVTEVKKTEPKKAEKKEVSKPEKKTASVKKEIKKSTKKK
jgi:small subunit ribosomal protein S2